jgi:hypothetical protein
MMQGELNTEKGLRYFNYGFILYMISLAVLLLLLIGFLSMLPDMLADADETTAEDLMAPLLGLIAGLCLGIIVILIALLLFLMGLLSLNNGKNEFGEPHANSFQKGVIFIVISIVVGIFGGVAGQVGSAVVSIFTAIMMALGLIYLIQEITDEQGQKLLWTAGILYIIIAVVSAIVNIWLFYSLGLADLGAGAEPSEDLVAEYFSAIMIPIAIGSLALIPILIFFFAYRRTYLRVKNREIQPVPLQMPFGPPPGYPQAPYPPYPQYPPQGPPPYSPPPQQHPYPPPQQNIGVKPGPPGGPPPGAVAPIATEVRRCVYCGSGVPKGAATCPACGKPA